MPELWTILFFFNFHLFFFLVSLPIKLRTFPWELPHDCVAGGSTLDLREREREQRTCWSTAKIGHLQRGIVFAFSFLKIKNNINLNKRFYGHTMERSKQKNEGCCCCRIQGRRFLFERTAPKQISPRVVCAIPLSFLTTRPNSRISDRSFDCWWGSGDTDGRASGWAIEWPSTKNANRSPCLVYCLQWRK